MAKSIHQFFPRTKAGNTIPGSEYTVKDSVTGLDADIFDSSDSETPKSQPYTADGNGKVSFYVEPGIYNIDSTDLRTGNTGSKKDVPIGVSRREIDDSNSVKQFDRTYATVADMKADISLQANSSKLIHTVDYYPTQRGGGASYLIKTEAQAVSDGDIFSASTTINILLGNGNVAVLQAVKSSLSLTQAGAMGGGSDDASIIQSAIDTSYSKGFSLVVDGVFTISSPLDLPPRINFRGLSSGSPKGTLVDTRPSEIISLGTEKTFTIGSSEKVEGIIEGIVFRGTGSVTATLIDDVKYSAILKECMIYNYAFVFGSGASLSVAHVLFNDIQAVKGTVFNCAVDDSFVIGNYINGASSEGYNATCFYIVRTTTISDNYIDFFKSIFGNSTTEADIGSCQLCRISGNQFERSFRVVSYGIGPGAHGRFYQSTFTNNVIRFCKSSTTISYFSNPDAQMQAEDWGWMVLDGITRSSIVSNHFDNCDVGIDVVGFPVFQFREVGNTYDPGNVTKPISFDVIDASSGNDLSTVTLSLFDTSGEFTPVINGSTTAGAGTYTTQSGKYTRVNNMISFEISIAWSAHTGTGNIQIDGLPYEQESNSKSYSVLAENLTFSGQLACISETPNTTKLSLKSMDSGVGLSGVPIDTNVTNLTVTGQYKIGL